MHTDQRRLVPCVPLYRTYSACSRPVTVGLRRRTEERMSSAVIGGICNKKCVLEAFVHYLCNIERVQEGLLTLSFATDAISTPCSLNLAAPLRTWCKSAPLYPFVAVTIVPISLGAKSCLSVLRRFSISWRRACKEGRISRYCRHGDVDPRRVAFSPVVAG